MATIALSWPDFSCSSERQPSFAGKAAVMTRNLTRTKLFFQVMRNPFR